MNKKNWLMLGALTFSVGVGISLAIDRDIKRAALTGLITLPATATGVSVVEQRRKRQLGNVLSSRQARVEELTKKETELTQQLSVLQTQVEDLKRQQVALDRATSDAIAKKQQLESNLAVQQTELDQLRTQVSAQQTHKQELEEALATLETQKQQLEQESRDFQTLLQELRSQETALRQSLVTLADERQQLEASLDSLQTELAQLQTQVTVQQQQTAALDSEQRDLEEQQQQLIAESQRLQTRTEELRRQESELSQSLVAIADQKQQLEENLNQHRTQLNQLQDQIATQESQSLELAQSLTALEQQKRQLQTESLNLQSQIDALEQERSQLSQSLSTVTEQQQEAQVNLSSLQAELSQLQHQVSDQQQQKAQLTQELAALASQKDLLEAVVRQLQSQTQEQQSNQPPASDQSILSQPTKTPKEPADRIQPKVPPAKILKEIPKSPEGTEDLSVDASETENPTPSRQRPIRNLHRRQTNLGSNFMNSRYTKQLWEERILPHWSHRDRPAGQRFLGSIRIKRTASDQLLDIVGQNLQQLDRVTYTSLYEEFYELEQNWLKVLTFALSEYAYYYSNERFWQGFCERLNINHNQGVEDTLRRVVDEGISLLGLVRARGGYKYVSTLWLQSGVPEQNLEHFARLVQEIADEYGWWELAHTPAEDLSQVLLSFCEEKHPQWGTLINFLKSSYSDKEETEPISGQLVQGIAIVAQELERQNASPQTLQDENQREELLGSYYLPNNFFLRNWNALIQVLTPKPGSSRNRGIITRRSKPLSLYLDVGDSLNTQLILPEQVLWKPEWRNLRGTYCHIPEADWEDTIPTAGDLEIPELVIDINQASEDWSCQLLNHNRQSLLKWHYEGIASALPCLVFDASTGNHLPLRLPSPVIVGVEEIICFTPQDIQPEFANGIDILDSYIPSSIRGWRGRQIRLTALESSIVLTLPQSDRSQLIQWKLTADEQPSLRGLRLKGKKAIYIEAPTFWYPPHQTGLTLNVLIENASLKTIIARTLETLSPNRRWFAIPLKQWITEPGCYEARFWFEQERWSYRFEVRSNYQIYQIPQGDNLRIESYSGGSKANLPIKHNSPEKFWSEVIKFEGLWPLEEVIFFLTDSNERVPYQLQADASGSITLDLSVLHDLLPEANWYALDYQRLGLEPQRLVEMEILPQVLHWTWSDRAIQLSGLQSGKFYSLSCWNLLLPDRQPVEIKIPLVGESSATTVIPLDLPAGIYHIQLLSPQQLPENLGSWCGNNQYDLPEEANENEGLENYCYTVLGNRESVEDFIKAIKRLKIDFDRQQIKTIIQSLDNHQYYFPNWLNSNSLLGKLKGLLKILNELPIEKIEPPQAQAKSTEIQPAKEIVTGTWYLVNTRPKKRDLFLKCLKIAIEQNKLQSLILEARVPQDSVFEDIVLLNLNNLKTVQPHLQRIDGFLKLERRPLKPEQLSRMLGA